jgi:hypothetical protein
MLNKTSASVKRNKEEKNLKNKEKKRKESRLWIHSKKRQTSALACLLLL